MLSSLLSVVLAFSARCTSRYIFPIGIPIYRFSDCVSRSRNSNSFSISGHVGCMVRALLARALSLIPYDGHQMTPTVPTARIGTAPDQRYDHYSNGHGFALTRPFAATSMILLRAMPCHLRITHQGMHIKSKLLAHLATNTNIECGHMRKVYLIILVLWKNGSGFDACTPINPTLCRSIRGWPSGPQEKKWSTKRSRPHSLVPNSAFVSIRDIRSARFSTAPDLSPTKSGGTQ